MLDSLQGNDRGCDLGSVVVVWGNTGSCCASLVCDDAGVWRQIQSGVFIDNISTLGTRAID